MAGRITIIETAGAPGGASLASWHELNLAAGYDTGSNADLTAFLTATLNRSGAIYGIAKPKPLTVSVGEHTWSETDANHIRTTTADVTVHFPDGSSLTKANVAFSNYYRPNQRLYALKPENGAYIDTGLTLDYSYVIQATGHTTESGQSVLVGASVSTSERTTLRMLGGSNKAQCCWPGLQDVTNSASGINFRQMLTYRQDSAGVHFEQDATSYDFPHSGTASGTSEAPILLFNETPTGDYARGTIREVIIKDKHDNVLRHFEPWAWNSEIVMLDIAHDNQVYRPAKGRLVEVVEE